MNCINLSHPELLKLSEELNLPKIVVASKISLWQESNNNLDRFPTASELYTGEDLKYTLKSIDIITKNLKRIEGLYKQIKDKDIFWSKLQKDFGIPKEQTELLKESEGNTFDEKLTNFVANYSYTVEVKTAKGQHGYFVKQNILGDWAVYTADGEDEAVFPTEQEAIKHTDHLNKNSSYYSNLTVPGGTNYTENEISTPAITSSIKGHAQFSTDNGIGWFRSDDKFIANEDIKLEDSENNSIKPEIEEFIQNKGINSGKKAWKVSYMHPTKFFQIEVFDNKEQAEKFVNSLNNKIKELTTKTRRILEVQSDLFQKGRDNKDLIERYMSDEDTSELGSQEEVEAHYRFLNKKESKNKFLQLLNKDNNWVTFFIKSIIQDSAKKGYEKVLFPKGDTASKIEGHTTLEEFKREKEERLKHLIETQKKYFAEDMGYDWSPTGDKTEIFDTKEEAEIEAKKLDFVNYQISETKGFNNTNEIKQLKEELKRVEEEGFAALKPIYKFYEETVGNILKKRFEAKEVTDEYNNGWYELDLSNTKLQEQTNTIRLQKQDTLEDQLKRSGYISQNHGDLFIKQHFYKQAINLIASINKENPGTIEVSKAQTTSGKGGRSIWKVKVNKQLNLPFNKDIVAQLFSNEAKRDKKFEKILETFLNNNGIPLDTIGYIEARFGVKATGLYRSAKIGNEVIRLVAISNDEAKRDTLPEEVGHVITDLLGKDHTLIQSLNKKIYEYNIDYKAYLGEEYVKIYQGNEEILKDEFIGKLIGRSMLNKYDEIEKNLPKNFLQKTKALIDRILNYFFNIFKKDDSKLKEAYKELYPELSEEIGQLANIALSGDKILSTTEPSSELRFQLSDNNNSSPITDKEIKRGLAYLSRKTKYLKNKSRTLYKEGKDEEGDIEEGKRLRYLAIAQEIKSTGNKQTLIDLGNYELDKVENFLDKLKSGELKIKNFKDTDIEVVFKILNQFNEITDLSSRSGKLKKELLPYLNLAALGEANIWNTRPSDLKMQDILEQSTDIDNLSLNFRALHDTSDILGQTAGSIIKSHQNTATRLKTEATNKIEKEVDKLIKYQKSKGIKDENLYDIFNQVITKRKKNKKGEWIPYKDQVLTMEGTSEFYEKLSESYDKLKSGTSAEILVAKKWLKENTIYGEKGRPKKPEYINPNWTKIQKIPELLRFYTFFKNEISNTSDLLPVDINTNFIPNLGEKNIGDLIKTGAGNFFKETTSNLLKIRTSEETGEIYDEELLNEDIIPLKYITQLSPDEKTKNLGEALLKFVEFGIEYSEMSEALPKLRIIQEVIKNKNYVHHNKTNLAIKGEESNIFKLIDGYINVQVKGKKKIDEGKWINWETVDENGNKVTKSIYISDIVDQMLQYNSLLRIGFNPVGAIKNVLFGRTANWLEAIGGRYFTRKELRQADLEFSKNFMNHDSKFWKLIELLNPLQELQDYENISKVRLKSTKDRLEKLKEMGYSMQKGGEFWLQTTPMIASMLHDKVETKEGKKISLYDAFELDKEGEIKIKDNINLNLDDVVVNKMSNKIQALNQLIHGRYSERDSSLASQHTFYRIISQFRKFIPTAIETRMVKKYFNTRLGVEVEGRYRVFGRVILGTFTPGKIGFIKMLGELYKTRKDLNSGKNFSELELYNMRKNLIEITLLVATLALGSMLLGGDDPDSKRRRKNAGVRFVLDLTNSVSGDLTYFYSPKDINKLLNNVAPLAKTVDDLILATHNLPYAFGGEDSEYQKGTRKGENKFYSRLKDLVPLYNPTQKTIRYFNGEDYNSTIGK